MRLVVSARQSDLARLQAYTAGAALRAAWPGIEIVFRFRESLGDRNQDDPLWRMPKQGVFTEDFVADLLEARTDLVVHSWKDLPVEPRAQTRVAATLPRADMRDVFLLRRDRAEEVRRSGRLRVLSSSPRRAYNLESFLREALPWEIAELGFEPVRGNVPTRLGKLHAGEADGLVAAKAALDRLLESKEEEFAPVRQSVRRALDRCFWMVLPLRANPTAAAQGALAVEIASRREDLARLLERVNHAPTCRDAEEERAVLRAHGGGCHQKIGVSVLTRDYGRILSLRGVTDAGEPLDRFELKRAAPPPPPAEPERVWPPLSGSEEWFEREEIPGVAQPGRALWVARSEALPRHWSVAPDQLVWTAGLETWKKLARRGVWVHGSAEGLGEREEPGIDTLAGSKPGWLKLSHDGEAAAGGLETLATYRLRPMERAAPLEGRTHFYWASGTSFLRALALCPSIRSGWHGCGPGNTYRILRDALGSEARIRIALSSADWLEEVLPWSA